jgi:Family of unknown function (DUF6039)
MTTTAPSALDETTAALNSGSCGLLLHRVGQFNYGFAREGRQYSRDLVGYMNGKVGGTISTFFYDEVFGVRDRVHWLVHLKAPNDYRALLRMVDDDDEFRDISLVDRLPEKGHGNWERMFVEGSMVEQVLLPQHGLHYHHEDAIDPALYVPAARNQTSQSLDTQLNSANAGAVVLRTADVTYKFREEGRLFAFDWQEAVNVAFPGRVTSLLFEQNFGRQDRIHWLIHLRGLEDYQLLREFDESEDTMSSIFAKQRIHESKGGGTWDELFVPASIHDVVMVP